MTGGLQTEAACRAFAAKKLEEEFRKDISPLIDALRKQFEAEDAVLLSMHPGAPK